MIIDLKSSPNSSNMWQAKLILKQVFGRHSGTNLISKETALSFQEEITNYFAEWEEYSKSLLQKYLFGKEFNTGLDTFSLSLLSSYCIFYDLPYNIDISHQSSYLDIFLCLQNMGLSTESITKIIRICDIGH